MKTTDLIRDLIRYRLTRNGLNLGMSLGEAALMAELRMKNEGLFGFFSGAKLMGSPEANITTIVEVFLANFISLLEANPDLVRDDIKDPANKQRSIALMKQSIDTVERHRARFIPGLPEWPGELHAYVVYRVQLEIWAKQRLAAEEIGLDEETVIYMVEEARKNFHTMRLG